METSHSKVRILDIDQRHHDQRLDNFLLGQLKGVPKSLVYKLLRSGQVRVNKGRKKPDYRLQQGDQVRMLAVAMEERHPLFPDVPTFKELGFDLVSGAYRGVAVPKSTPEALRKQISDMIGEINQDPDFRQRLVNDGMALLDVGYEDMEAFMAEMTETYSAAAKEAGVLD